MKAKDIILTIKQYALSMGVDFDVALKMLSLMHEDGVHLEEELEVVEGETDE